MATIAKQFSCFFLIILSTCHLTQARESRFFSKYLHFSTNNYVNVPRASSTNLKLDVPSSPTPSSPPTTSQISGVPASAPMSGPSTAPTPTTLEVGDTPAPAPIALGADYTPSPAPASTTVGADPDYTPVPAPSEDEVSYYGLYGKNNNEEEEEEEFSTVDPEEQNSNKETYTYSNDELSNDNSFWTSNHKGYYDTNSEYGSNGGYNSKPQGMSDTRIADNSKYHYNTELENYSPNELKSDPQGMSDTRLVNNGKYYYSVEQENYSPVEGENNNEEGHYFGGSSYKNSKYEFDSMEEYEKQQGYADVQQEEYINP